MNKPVITVKNISKSYNINHEMKASVGNVTFRDAIIDTLKKPKELLTGHIMKKEKFWALKGIDFDINKGEVIGIIGKNGSGKSTLLKIMSRITEPTTGEIVMNGRVASLLEVGTGFHPELTGRENVYFNGSILGMKKKEIDAKFDEIVAFSEIEKFLDTPVKFYSSGMYVRLAFAVAAHLDPDILIIDEVLAVGDAAFQKKCLGKMKDVAGQGRTVIFVSHTMKTVEELCTRGVLLKNGKIEKIGSIDEAIAGYMGRQKSKEKVIYSKGLVKEIVAKQKGKEIIISLKYNNSTAISPHLGFVIKDHMGNKVGGSNPTINPPKIALAKSVKGIAIATITGPQLLDGTYTLSVWFGDGKEDLFNDEDCITLEIKDMSKVKNLNSMQLGSSFVECEWSAE